MREGVVRKIKIERKTYEDYVNLFMERLREGLKEEKKKERKYKIVWLFMESLREMGERGKREGKKM